MGNHIACQLGCGGPCEQCCATWCGRKQCAQVCFGQRCQRPIVQNLQSALDEKVSQSPAEHYDHPGEDVARGGQVCGFYGPMSREEEQMLEQAMGHLPDHGDQVQPSADDDDDDDWSQSPMGGQRRTRGAEAQNVGERLNIEALEDECRFNAGKVHKIRRLAEAYGHWRPIRGDGNCFYRTVAFGAIEASFQTEVGVEEIAAKLSQVRFEDEDDQRSHIGMLTRLRAFSSPDELEQWVIQDREFDEALIRSCRRLVRDYLCGRADKESPSGLTYEDLVRALDPSYKSVEDFCEKVIDPMGRDAETLALDALPSQLGIGLRLWILDRRGDVDLANVDMAAVDGRVHVHALFKPGHYDLLYVRSAGTLDEAMATRQCPLSPQKPSICKLPTVAEVDAEAAECEEEEGQPMSGSSTTTSAIVEPL
mmetsp:Transcript_16071/g.46480  ORF Transcript_16071/g.46480 Transcript_16071/m.46480 type:complete len:422 (+) Transcript_16071:169-1434(+)